MVGRDVDSTNQSFRVSKANPANPKFAITSHLTTTTTFSCKCSLSLCNLMASGQPESAAQRRKGRRLRATLRHGQQSIAVALATTALDRARRRCRSSRTPLCGDRTLIPEPGKRREAMTTTRQNARRLFLPRTSSAGRGQTVCLHGGSGPQAALLRPRPRTSPIRGGSTASDASRRLARWLRR